MTTEREQELAALRDYLVGKPADEARELCKAHGWTLRCRTKDGQALMGTCDFRTDRVNYREVNGVVAEVTGIG